MRYDIHEIRKILHWKNSSTKIFFTSPMNSFMNTHELYGCADDRIRTSCILNIAAKEVGQRVSRDVQCETNLLFPITKETAAHKISARHCVSCNLSTQYWEKLGRIHCRSMMHTNSVCSLHASYYYVQRKLFCVVGHKKCTKNKTSCLKADNT